MTANQFTVDDVLQAFSRLDGDRVNPRNNEDNCEYSVNGDGVVPSCLVGSIVFELDKRLFGKIADTTVGWSYSMDGLAAVKARFTDAANTLLEEAQNEADENCTWAFAMREAQAVAA